MDSPTDLSPKPPARNSLSPQDLVVVTNDITNGFVQSLKSLQAGDLAARTSLIPPARVLIWLGALLEIVPLALRIWASTNFFTFNDAIAFLVAGFLSLQTAVFLYCFQYHSEQASGAAKLKATQEVTRGLVAKQG